MAANNLNKMTTKSTTPENINGVSQDRVTVATIIVNKNDGTTQITKDALLYNGSLYDSITGNILGSTSDSDDNYSKEKWTKDFYIDDNSNTIAVFTEKISEKITTIFDNDSKEPTAPSGPQKITWDEPFPTFSSDYKTVKRYIYHLGIDEAKFTNVVHEENSVCVTPYIEIGTLGTEEFLMLEAEFKGAVEFYILDGDKSINILPTDQTKIEDEKMFFGLSPRFIVDSQYEVVVKRNGIVVNQSYESILDNIDYWANDVSYSMTYFPVIQNTYRPMQERVQLKIIMRGISSVSRLAFRYYAENHYLV